MRPWESFPLMVGLGAVLGAIVGPVPYAGEVSTAALVVAMTVSLTEVRFRGLTLRGEAGAFGRAFLWNYVVLSGVILALSALYAEPDVRRGWIVMAAGPSAIAIVPLTATFRGDTRKALVSTALLYLAALGLYPLFTLAFAGRTVDLGGLAAQMILQIALPMAASRALARSRVLAGNRPPVVNASFFVLVFALVGLNRNVFLQAPALIGALAAGAFVRTWVVGAAAYVVSGRLAGGRAQRLSDALFASLKNLALAALFALSLFGPVAALPAIVCLFFEIAWLVPLQRLFRRERSESR